MRGIFRIGCGVALGTFMLPIIGILLLLLYGVCAGITR